MPNQATNPWRSIVRTAAAPILVLLLLIGLLALAPRNDTPAVETSPPSEWVLTLPELPPLTSTTTIVVPSTSVTTTTDDPLPRTTTTGPEVAAPDTQASQASTTSTTTQAVQPIEAENSSETLIITGPARVVPQTTDPAPIFDEGGMVAPEIAGLDPAVRGSQTQINPPPPETTTTTAAPAPPRWPTSFRYNDCGWVRDELISRNVRGDVVSFITNIANRESGCCPFVKGGDSVGANCEFLRVAETNHRSDTGLFQLNGVHWKTSAGFICPEFTCNQDTLLYDINMQFDAMLVLYAKCGTRPWTAPNYGCSPANPYN